MISVFSWTSFSCILMFIYFISDLHAKAFYDTWRILEDKINEFKTNIRIPEKDLANAMKEGELYIAWTWRS